MSDVINRPLLDKTVAYIKEQMLQQNLSVATLADLAVVSKDTINNIIYHRSKNPGYELVLSLVYALGGSVDEIVGHSLTALPDVVAPESVSDVSRLLPSITRGWLQAQANSLAMLRQERRMKVTWMVVAMVLIVVIIAVLAVDAANGAIGFIRYQIGLRSHFASLLG